MRIPLRHPDILVTQKLGHLVEINTGLNEPCRKGMAKVMEPEILNLRFFSLPRETAADVSVWPASRSLARFSPNLKNDLLTHVLPARKADCARFDL